MTAGSYRVPPIDLLCWAYATKGFLCSNTLHEVCLRLDGAWNRVTSVQMLTAQATHPRLYPYVDSHVGSGKV